MTTATDHTSTIQHETIHQTTALVDGSGWISGSDPSRAQQYEAILGQIATGVFILETSVPGDARSLEVVVVNEMGRRFFGRDGDDTCQVLAEAGH